MKRTLTIFFVLLFVGLLLLLNLRMHQPGDIRTTIAQLQFIQQALNDGAAERMQKIFPEGYVFTWALYGLTSAQVASQLNRTDALHTYYLGESKKAVQKIRSSQARATFSEELDPPFGAFYSAWSNYLLAEYIRASGPENVPAALLESFEDDCFQFSEALSRSNSPFLSSYSNASWPADTAVGIAALGIHDAILSPKYDITIGNWVAKARTRLDGDLAALSHAADPDSGRPIGGVRGSSLALMSRVLVDADPQFALEQYTVLRQYFVDYTWGVPGIREYPHGVSGIADIDSGPIILGYSGPAVVVGAAAAQANGDEFLASVLFGMVESTGLPVQLREERQYMAGLLPVGDAFISWSRSSPLPEKGERISWRSLIPWWWAIPLHLFSMILAGVLILPILRFRRRVAD